MLNQHLPLQAPAPGDLVHGRKRFHRMPPSPQQPVTKIIRDCERGLGLSTGAPQAGAEFQRSRDRQIFFLFKILLLLLLT